MATAITFETYAGHDRSHDLTIVVAGSALDLTDATITLTVRRHRADVNSVFQLTSPLASGIDITDATAGTIRIYFRDDITQGLEGLYVHELTIVTAAGDLLKVAEGPLIILP